MSDRTYGGAVILDHSAWARLVRGQVDGAEHERWLAAVEGDEIVVCDPFRLEALYSARDAREYRALEAELDGFRQAPGDAQTWQLARDAQRALADARRVSHRVKVVDLLVAAVAHQNGLGILHYDHDYDTISAHTALRYTSVWIAPRGSLT